MKQISTILFTALAGYVHLSAAIGDATYYGCYNSSGSLQTKGDDNFQSRGKCRETCVKDPGYSVQAMTNSTLCLCGNYLPNNAYKVDDSKCKQGCPGFVQETCKSFFILYTFFFFCFFYFFSFLFSFHPANLRILDPTDALYRWHSLG